MDVGPSFAKFALENGHSYNLTEMEVAYLAGTFFGAGSDTVSLDVLRFASEHRDSNQVLDFYGDMHGTHGSRMFSRGAS
jgi:hypothetical protein